MFRWKTMDSNIKKLMYIPWVLFLFGIAAILTLFELVFRKGRSIAAFSNNGAWSHSSPLMGNTPASREVSNGKKKHPGQTKDEKLPEMRLFLSLEAQVQPVVWELFPSKRRNQLRGICLQWEGNLRKAYDILIKFIPWTSFPPFSSGLGGCEPFPLSPAPPRPLLYVISPLCLFTSPWVHAIRL